MDKRSIVENGNRIAAKVDALLREELGDILEDEEAFASVMSILQSVAADTLYRLSPGDIAHQAKGVHILAKSIMESLATLNKGNRETAH